MKITPEKVLGTLCFIVALVYGYYDNHIQTVIYLVCMNMFMTLDCFKALKNLIKGD